MQLVLVGSSKPGSHTWVFGMHASNIVADAQDGWNMASVQATDSDEFVSARDSIDMAKQQGRISTRTILKSVVEVIVPNLLPHHTCCQACACVLFLFALPVSDLDLTGRCGAQVATLIFFAEWGDRSMIATVALGAAKSPAGKATAQQINHALPVWMGTWQLVSDSAC